MIIQFTPDVTQMAAQGETVHDFIENLADASLKGLHFIFVSPTVIDWSLINLDLSKRQKAHLSRVAQEYPERKYLAESAPALIKVGLGNAEVQRTNSHHFTAGHERVLNSRVLERPLLLLENSEADGALFNHILEEVRKRIRAPKLHYQIVGAGGTNVIAETRNYAAAGHTFFTILDGDCLSPFDGESTVVKACNAEILKTNVVAGISPIGCRDVENLFSIELIKTSSVLGKTFVFDPYEIILSRKNKGEPSSNPMLYFDMKDGLNLKKVHGLPDSPTRRWIEDNFSLPNEAGDLVLTNIQGFGKNILSNIMANGLAMKAFRSEVRSDGWIENFGAPFITAAWYFVAAGSQKT